MKINSDEYISWLKNGRSFQDVRDDLVKKGVSEEDISKYIRALDKMLINESVLKEGSKYSNSTFWVGLVITLTGSLVTLYSYLSGYGTFVLAYGAILGGVAIMFTSKRK